MLPNVGQCLEPMPSIFILPHLRRPSVLRPCTKEWPLKFSGFWQIIGSFRTSMLVNLILCINLYSVNESLLETNGHTGCAKKACLFENYDKGWLVELITLNYWLVLIPFENISAVQGNRICRWIIRACFGGKGHGAGRGLSCLDTGPRCTVSSVGTPRFVALYTTSRGYWVAILVRILTRL